MATFVNGITDYIPQFQPDIPNLDLIQQTLRVKQSQYDANYAQWERLQEGILKAPLSHADNIQERDKFFQAADKAIKKISASDLSKPQNLSVAERLFDPLINNTFIAKDIAFTKNWQQQYQRGLDSQDCVDPKKCPGRYNPEGLEALQYQMENFKSLPREATMKAAMPKYVYDPNINKRLTDLIKDIEPTASVTEVEGQWIVTTKMGDKVQAELNNILHNAVANDPQVQEYMRNKAFVQRERFIRSSDMPREEANLKYNQDILGTLIKGIDNNIASATASIDQIEYTAKKLIDASGDKIPENSPIIARINQWNTIKKTIENNLQFYKDQKQELENLHSNPSSTQIDDLIASSLLDNQISTFAKSYSALKEEVDIKANPYAVNQQKFNFDAAIEKLRDQNEKDNIMLKARMDAARDQLKFDLENANNALPGGDDGVEVIHTENSATRAIDNVSEHNTKTAVMYSDKAKSGQKQYLLELYSNLEDADRNRLFKKPDGSVYTLDELQNLDPRTLQETAKGKASQLGILYHKITTTMNTAGSSDIPAVQARLAGLQATIALNERAAKGALDAYYSNKTLVSENLMKNPKFAEILTYVAQSNDPELKKLFSRDDNGDINVNETLLLDIISKEEEDRVKRESTSTVIAPAIGYGYYSSKERLRLVKQLQETLENTKSKTFNDPSKQIKVYGADVTLDQSGNPQISYPTTGFTTTVNSTDKTEAQKTTLSLLNSLDNVYSTQKDKIKIYDANRNEIEEGGNLILAQLKAGFANPNKGNVLQINSVHRSENLTYKNEFDDTKVLYKISVAPTTAAAIAKTTGKDFKQTSEIIIEVDKNSDRSNFVNASTNLNAANTILRGGDKISQKVTNPVTGDEYELVMTLDENGQLYKYMKLNGTFLKDSYSILSNDIDAQVVVEKTAGAFSSAFATQNNEVAIQNKSLESGYITRKDAYNLIGIKQ